MKQSNRFSARASLAAIGVYMRRFKVWETIEACVQVKQKQVKHSLLDKLLDAFINHIRQALRGIYRS